MKKLSNFTAKILNNFTDSLNKPMATSISSTRGFIISLLVGLFVAIVATGVQPFGLAEFNHESKTLFLAGFGLVAFIGMLIAKFIFPIALPNFYNDQTWTVARQITHLTVSVFVVGILIMFYAQVFAITQFSIVNILVATAISIIPAAVITFIQQGLFHNKFTSNAENITSSLGSINPPASQQLFPVMVFGESGKKLSLVPNQLIYAETSKDSTDFYWQSLMGVEKTTIQTPLSQVEKELAAHPQFVRLHRNFVVNMRGIHKVEGNARGYRLRIARTKHEIPVSRKFHKKLEQLGQ
ncbi:LytTr DNA-binding region [Emticicia oligotrophica DSM 17448]|uniref:LytTr DNA-binding region n=1 Tax=Emticicia oligotrophica (strain DSM 17448 / CIP 109782 / MTCC 6937 / GPTSA100-15) TaxID=929562 RepID=A0ABM5N069_EMTOG|nr:LytTR family DNA-binding domain-containing protein [Emticicia oligotrophica]AFK02662.1 LytTr DNA-binding region [Emticicia oligotrophica DSM 17448]